MKELELVIKVKISGEATEREVCNYLKLVADKNTRYDDIKPNPFLDGNSNIKTIELI